MLVEHLPFLEYLLIFCMHPCSACTPLIPLYSLTVQPRPNYPLLFCCKPAGYVGGLLLAGQFSAVCPTCPAQLFPFRFGVRARPSRPGSDWYAQLVRCNLVGQMFQCSDRGMLLGQFGIGAQLGIGERGICYYTVVHTLTPSAMRRQYVDFSREKLLRVSRNRRQKYVQEKNMSLCEPRARYLNTWGSDHVERSPTPTKTAYIKGYNRWEECVGIQSVIIFFLQNALNSGVRWLL